MKIFKSNNDGCLYLFDKDEYETRFLTIIFNLPAQKVIELYQMRCQRELLKKYTGIK